jgi:predicted NBD/HSP70 family sugar kinase
VFRIFSQLQADGIIRDCTAERQAAGTKGRKPSFYCVVPESFYTVGIDFWAGSQAVVVADFAGNAEYSEVVDTAPDSDAETVMREISALVERAVDSSGVDVERVLGVGVGAPGIVDIETGTVIRYPRIPGLDGYGVKARLEQDFGWPVHVHNNAAVMALGEYRYGQVAGQQSVMAFLIRSGVGGAFLQDGKILTNRGRTVLEVGHMVVDPNGPACEGGWGGCLESYLSEGAIGSALERAGYGSLQESVANMSGERAFEVAELETAGRRFAQAIHTLSNLFNPMSYLIVSRYEWLSDFLAGAAHRFTDNDAPGLGEAGTRVVGQTYDAIRACRGATDLVLDSFFARS